MKEHLRFLQKHNLQDGLLREFVHKGLRGPAIVACNDAISLRMKEARELEILRDRLIDELEPTETVPLSGKTATT